MFWIFLAVAIICLVLLHAAITNFLERDELKPVGERRLKQLTILDPEESTVVIVNKPKGRQE